jgi:hypothetical protein
MTRWHASNLERLTAAGLAGRLAAKLHTQSDTA